jgi:RNA polymerase sigma factor (sigma-70 family)
MDNVMRQIRLMAGRPHTAQSDEELLDQFLAGANEDAFAALVRRHGAMVLGVCLRLLHHRQDAEDAFQATFLTLVRKGRLIRHRGALSSWLYRVAFRAALRLKTKADKLRTDALTEVAVDADPTEELGWRELRPVLDTEVNRLPAKYRAPIVLCYLEGKTYEEAAGQLGCPKGTIAIRLLRGKVLLKNRLARRGLALSAGLVAGNAALAQALASVPMALQTVTAAAGVAVAAGTTVSAATSVAVASLVRAVTHEIWVKKLQTAAVMFVGLTLTGVGIGSFAPARNPNRSTEVVMTTRVPPAPVTQVAKAEPPPPAPSLQQEQPPKPAEPVPSKAVMKADGSRSIVVIDCSPGGTFSDEDATHLIRGWSTPLRHETRIYIRHVRSASEKRGPSGLALRDQLTGDEAIPAPVPQATEQRTSTTRTAVVYRIKLKNGDEVHLIVINPA